MIKKLIGINYNTSGTSGTSGVSGTTNVTVSTSGTSGSSGTAGTTGTAFIGSQIDTYSATSHKSAAGIWTKPIGAKVIEVICIGGGGGGGSGSVNNGTRYGGGGGQGGGYSRMIFNASSLPSTVTCWGGPRGTGGSRVTNVSSNGNNGVDGETSYFGSFLSAVGGAGALGGGNSGGLPTISYGLIENGGYGSNPPNISAAVDADDTKYAPSGGGAGGSIVSLSGSAGGAVRLQINTQGAGGGLGLPGGTASSYTNQLMGAGGGGGGASGTNGSGTNGGDGADGLLYGAGGGGGGSSTLTPDPGIKNSGAGGDGAGGVVIVITYF